MNRNNDIPQRVTKADLAYKYEQAKLSFVKDLRMLFTGRMTITAFSQIHGSKVTDEVVFNLMKQRG